MHTVGYSSVFLVVQNDQRFPIYVHCYFKEGLSDLCEKAMPGVDLRNVSDVSGAVQVGRQEHLDTPTSTPRVRCPLHRRPASGFPVCKLSCIPCCSYSAVCFLFFYGATEDVRIVASLCYITPMGVVADTILNHLDAVTFRHLAGYFLATRSLN